ncbi:MAG: FAD:protein FMN transferase [Thermoanaerobaculales bacterium]|nr:FAD:protein FMN transferase [Thermoanaerobaculales bacterium]
MSRSSGPPPLRRLILPGLFVAGLFAIYFLRQGPQTAVSRELAITGPTMGTTFNVKVVTDHLSEADKERLTQLVREALDGVDERMSTYRSESEIEAFNRSGTQTFRASSDLLDVVAEAQRVARLTGGAFDITVGPLVDIWGFGPPGATETPDEERLRELVAVTGFEQLEVDVDRGTLRKAREDCRIDLSAIAKGFGADRVSEALVRSGLPNHMVEVGGEVCARGFNGSGQLWRIGIERPTVEGRSVQIVVPLADLSLATSGDYRNFFERDGVRISHTIDPRSGRPISHNLASVSVIHASCMTADALATALGVLGPDEGFDLAERQDIPAYFLVRVADGVFEERQTTGWSALIENSTSAATVD